MKLIHFTVDRLHGFLDIDLAFKDDITIIVGRNGSGKTSALNLISDFLRLDLVSLKKVPFSAARLELSDSVAGKVVIVASNDDSSKEITITIGDSAATFPLSIPLEIYMGAIGKQQFTWRELIQFGPHMQSSFPNLAFQISDWFPLAEQFAALPKLTFVKLDRTIAAMDSSGSERLESNKVKVSTSIPTQDPIDEVLKVTTQKFGEYKRSVEQIKSSAFNQLLQLHFEPISPISSRAKSTQVQLKAKLAQLRRRVEGSALFADSREVRTNTKSFFDSFSELLFEPPSDKPKRKTGRRSLIEESGQILLNLKEKQIEKLLAIFDGEQEEVQKAYAPIGRYFIATSKFFKESGKELQFDTSLRLGFTVPSASSAFGPEPVKQRSLKELASGERQVIIVLTYLAFLAGENSIFIIDEPELSLHLRWQAYLIEAVKQLRPAGCQIIVATHAPEIAGRAKNKIVLLKPGYLPAESE